MRELPRQLTADELAELFSGRTRLVERLAAVDDPLGRAYEVALAAPEDEQAEALAAHPRIGEALTPSSAATSPRCSPELAELNAAYEDRFGFRFVVFVNRRPRSEIVPVLRERLGHTREQELRDRDRGARRDCTRPVAASVIAGLDPYVTDWLDLLGRWLHVIAAIVWIGTSFYFVALDNHLLPPKRRSDREEGVGGESWEIHGGGFYRIEKYRVAPRVLPEPLHWFKWEAYTTWLSGFALFVVLYYANASTYLIDPSVADLTPAAAVAISLALLVGAWLVYDVLCRLAAGHELLLAAAIAGCVTATAYGGEPAVQRARDGDPARRDARHDHGRERPLRDHPGPLAARPGEGGGREPDPAAGLRGKQRSVHNNYLTLPVAAGDAVAALPVHHRRADGWLVLVGLMAVGAWIRLFFNLRHAGPQRLGHPGHGRAGDRRDRDRDPARGGRRLRAGPAGAVRRGAGDRRGALRAVPLESPTNPSFSTAPAGVVLDTPEQIAPRPQLIEEQAVDSQAMPLGNVTGMTDEERELLGAWIAQGADTGQ